MKRPLADLPALFWGTLRVSALTFGGGYVIVPLLSEAFSKKRAWIDEESMLDIVAIAQASPGAMAVNCSILIGWRTFGPLGALVALLATVLPPLVILTLLSYVYRAIIDSPLVQAVFRGLMVGVSIVIGSAIWSMQAMLLKRRRVFPVLLMAAAFVLHFFLRVNAVYLILAALALGVGLTLVETKRSGREP